MKTLVQLMIVAIIFGGLSTAATLFMQPKATPVVAAADDPKLEKSKSTDEADPAGKAKPSESPESDSHEHAPVEEAHSSSPHDDEALRAAEPPKHASPVKVPKPVAAVPSQEVAPQASTPDDSAESRPEARVAVRPPYTPEGDEAGGLINLLRERSRSALESERRLAERQDAMQLIFEDLRGEQTRTLKIRERLSNELKESRLAVDAALLAVEEERAALQKSQADVKKATEDSIREATAERDKLRKELEKATSSPAALNGSASTGGPPEDNVNLKKMATVFDGMPAENVSSVFEQLVKNKRTDAVVSLMNAMKERQVAKVLANIATTNAELAADLTDRLKRLKTTKPAAE